MRQLMFLQNKSRVIKAMTNVAFVSFVIECLVLNEMPLKIHLSIEDSLTFRAFVNVRLLVKGQMIGDLFGRVQFG